MCDTALETQLARSEVSARNLTTAKLREDGILSVIDVITVIVSNSQAATNSTELTRKQSPIELEDEVSRL
jgi:hypothetical protein